MWASILALSGLAAAIGFAIVNNSTSRTGALLDAFAAGALLTMIADEMAPEAMSETVSTLASQPLPGSLSPSSSPVSNSPARHATTHSELDADDYGQLPRTDHALCAITHVSESAIDRHFLSGSDGHGLGSFWTCRGAAVGIAMQRMAPRMAPKRHPVHQRSRGEALAVQGLAGTPGGTRIPNLLIRRWTHPVHSRPQPSVASGTNRFAVHSRP